MTGIIILFSFLAVILVAFMSIIQKSLPDAIILFMGVGLGAVVLFFVFQAPDVALTEAVIGSGISTLIFLMALKHLKAEHEL